MSQEEKISPKEHAQILVMNSWYKQIPEAQRNIIIANALNTCVIDKSFKITGYLITNTRIFLIGYSEKTPFQDVLEHFYLQVEIGIVNYKKMRNQYSDAHHLEHYTPHKLFTLFPFYNDDTRKLITGKKVSIPYYDPRLARLKDYIHHHNYCSILDYAGGESRVIVAIERNE